MAMEGVVAQNGFPSISVTPFAKNSMRKFHLCHAHTRTTRCSSAIGGVPLDMEKFIHNYHNIIKQCAFVHVGPREYHHGMSRTEFAPVAASHGYILGVHVSE